MNEAVNRIALEELDTISNTNESSLLKQDMDLFGHVKVALTVEVGQVVMNIDELMSAKKGDVLRLEQEVDEPLTLLVDRKPIAKANLVAVGDNFGVEIVEISE